MYECVCVFSIIRGIVDAVNNTARALIVTLKLKGIGRAATEIVDGAKRWLLCGWTKGWMWGLLSFVIRV